MNLQGKLVETTAGLRARALSFATTALPVVRARLVARAAVLRQSLQTLSAAGRELNKVARTHTARFVKENSAIATKAGRDVSALARTTYATLTQIPAPMPKARRPRAAGTAKRRARAAKTA